MQTPLLRFVVIVSFTIISYRINLKPQNRLKVGTDKPKLEIKIQAQAVSDDSVQKKNLLKSHVLSWLLLWICCATKLTG